MRRIDFNCDLGEGAGYDAELMPLITSANIACGAHAGDAATMRATVVLARRYGVAAGAHPGFADREHFGRHERVASPKEVFALVCGQAIALQKIAAEEGVRLRHVKPHGALYNQVSRDAALARAVAEAVREVDRNLVLVALAGSELMRAGNELGLRVAGEVFADRAYRADGSLVPRSQPGALFVSEEAVCAQALGMATRGIVKAVDGAEVTVQADTLCLHGDGPHAVMFAQRLRRVLAGAGVEVRSFDAG